MKFGYLAALAAIGCSPVWGMMSVTSLTPSVQSPQPLGTPVTFSAVASDTGSGPVAFQFSVGYQSNPLGVISDFSIGAPQGAQWSGRPFTWATIRSEGDYTIKVVARDFSSGESASATLPFHLSSLVSHAALTVVPTANPLVFIAAIPPCPQGSTATVTFTNSLTRATGTTPAQNCNSPLSSNVYLAGVYPGQSYYVTYSLNNGGLSQSSNQTAVINAGPAPGDFSVPPATINVAAGSQAASAGDGVILNSWLNPYGTLYRPTATDLAGNVIWYYDASDPTLLMVRALPGGNIVFFQSGTDWKTGTSVQNFVMREVDLAGNIVWDENIGNLQQQLSTAAGLQPCASVKLPAQPGAGCITSFSHDALVLPNGNIATIVTVEKIFPPGTQGDTTGQNVDVLGDAIVVLDNNLNPVWWWNAFDHGGGGKELDVNRAPVLGEHCTPHEAGCGALFLAGTSGIPSLASDWLHSNSLYYDPSDGNFLLSIRHQDWVVKINYSNGSGDGSVLWRMGPQGDFAIVNTNNDLFPWFSHQHDVSIDPKGELLLFDNGNTRVSPPPVGLGLGNSRGMALRFDERSRTVTPSAVYDIGAYSYAVGSAQLLENGDYYFGAGFVLPWSVTINQEYSAAASTSSNSPVFSVTAGTPTYRSFRQPDIYSARPTYIGTSVRIADTCPDRLTSPGSKCPKSQN